MNHPISDISKYVAIITGAVFFMSAYKLVIIERMFKVPILNFFNFSNLLVYFFNTMAGLIYFIVLGLIYTCIQNRCR